jgi:MoaA/NifB/PqqE/SkfB family radical SAM enzyme
MKIGRNKDFRGEPRYSREILEVKEKEERMIRKFIGRLRRSRKSRGFQSTENRDICKSPFEKILIGDKGNVYTCCPSWLPQPIGNIFVEPDFNKTWNSGIAQKIRASMINETYEFCSQEYCPYLLNGEFKPKKKKPPDDDNRTTGTVKTILNTGPVEMNLFYDYTCNLYCKFCRNHVKTLDKERTESLLKFQENLVKSPLFQGVRRLFLAGQGEVFASKIYLSLLKSIDEKRFPKLRITLLTNGTLLTPANWEKIRSAHYAIDTITVSVDAAARETYNKVRRGGNFDTLQKNLEFLARLKNEKEFKLKATFVMQKENYKEIPAFVNLMKTYRVDGFYFQKLINHGTYTEEEHRQAAVHRKDHPEHNAFLEILKNPVLKHRGITIQMKSAPGKSNRVIEDMNFQG